MNQANNPTPYRDYCYTCWQAKELCLCPYMPRLKNELEIILIQHPRERRMTINTGRLVHLSLAKSQVHYGVQMEKCPSFQKALSANKNWGILFPSPSAVPIEEAPADLEGLVVIDGTWTEAKKILHRSSCLHTLPRYSLAPAKPSNYRIRKAPQANFLSTVEASVAALRQFEGKAEAYEELIDIFQRMVRQQEGYCEANPRHKINRKRQIKIRERSRLKKLLFSTIPTERIHFLKELPEDERLRIENIANELWGLKNIYQLDTLRPLFKNETEQDETLNPED